MKITLRHFFLGFLFITLPQFSFAQLSSAEIDALVTTAMEKMQVAGVGVAVVKDGKIIHEKGYGVKSISGGGKVNEHTQFAIASNSKAFTTAALAILVEEGKMSWEDKVVDHLPNFKMYNDYVTQEFNIIDLLTHRSGLGLGAGDLMLFPDGTDFTIDDVLSAFQHFEPQSAFRTKFDYDNLLYIVAGEIIAKVSGQPWEIFVKERIMNPLGMDDAVGNLGNMKDQSNLATPHAEEDGELKEIEHYVFDPEKMNDAAGGIYASVHDISQWMLMHLNGGKYGEALDKVLFSKKSQRLMWTIHTSLSPNRNPRYNAHFSGYGLGWSLTEKKGTLNVSHTGGIPGMLSRTVMVPDLDLGVVVLTNTSEGGAGVFESVTRTIVDSYLELDDFSWTEKLAAYFENREGDGDSVVAAVWKVVEEAKGKSIDIEAYVGTYEDDWFGAVVVEKKNNQLWLSCLRSPKLNGRLFYYKANAFVAQWEYQDMNADAFVIFSLDEEGRAAGIKMKGISPNIDFSFDFQDLDLRRVE